MKHFKQFFVFALLALFSIGAWGATATYTVASTSTVDVAGAPTDATVSYSSTYSSKEQLTAGNSMTLTLSGYTGYKITAITLSMKSNSSKGAGSFSAVAGSTTIASISDAKFNDASWNGAWSTSYVNITPTMSDDDYEIQSGEDVVLTISASANSIYCQSFTITYEEAGSTCQQLAAPANPSSTPAQTNVVLSWDAVEHASGYKVVFNGTDYDIASGTTTKTIEGLAMETEYHWTVAAKGDGTTYCALGAATAQQTVTTLDACTENKAVYTVATKSSVTSSGALEDTDATFSNTGTNNNDQMTGGKAMTLTLSGYDGATIKGLTLSMHSNGSSGAGTFSLVIGSTTVASISDATTFNKWFDNTSYGTTYRNVHVTFADDVVVGTDEDIVVTIAATTNSLYCQSFSFCYEEPVAAAVAKPTISGETPFLGSTTVTISHADADAIYYTTDGSDPKTSGAKLTYFAPFTVNAAGTTTVKAYAVKGIDESDVAEKAFTKVVSYTTIADIYTKAVEVGSTATDIYVTFNNWIVTGVKNSNVYLTDGTNGLIIYGSGHNFEAGDILSGTAACKVQLYNGNIELTSLTASTAGLTVIKGGVAAVNVLDTDGIAALTAKNTGSVIKISGEYTSDGKIAGVKVWNNLYSFSLTVGTSYECTGVYFNGGETHGNEIMPRSADDIVVVAAATLEEVTGLAALKAEATGTSYLLNLTDAIVTLVDGNNAFIEDATAGALIYFSGHGYAAGDKLNGQYEVTTATYQGKFEITAMEAQTGATKVADAEIPVTTMTIAQLNANFAANESKRIKIVGVNVTDAVESGDATARTGEISDGENTITLYAGKSGVTAAENANIDVIGYPTFHNTDQQLAVWAQADITVNVKEDPELAYTPASESIELGDSWNAPTLANPHNLPLSFSSDKEALATVTDAGVIALVADATGTATITASFAGDATYNAGSATYTITVSVPDTRKKATLENIAAISGSFDRTDITYAAYQGDGTTPPAANGTDLRLYKPATGKETGGYIVISAVKGCTIDEVVVTNGDSKATTIGCSTTATLATSGEAYAKNASVSFESLNSSVVYIDNIGSDRMDIIKIEVYYTGEPASVHHLTLSGTYPTEFEQGDAFDYTGLVVTAAYDEEETDTEDVTSAANVSTPDMNTIGEKTITVSYGGKYTEYTITVNAAAGADDISGVWTLVTDATALEAGMKVIIAQHVDADGAIYTMGDQKSNNRGAVESAVAGSILTPNFKTRVFELEDAGSGMFALKAVEDSKYLYAAASGNNYMKSQESIDDNAKWTITVDADGVASIVATNSSNRNVMQFNSGSSLFSCYGTASQTDIALYTRAKEKREGFTVGKLATVCVPYAVAQEDIIGADVYEIAGKNEAGKIVFDQVTTGGMEAGVAYLVQAKAETATFYYSGNAVAAPKNEGKALKGTFDGIDIDVADAANVYFFKDNALWSAKETGVKILAYRAWLDMSAVGNAGPSPAPGRRRITMDVHGENAATGMDELNASEAPRKMIIDGQLYILRGEKMYNANGILVK